jgi:hypothetical protein
MIQEFSTQLQVWGLGMMLSLCHRKAFIHKVKKKAHNAKKKRKIPFQDFPSVICQY